MPISLGYEHLNTNACFATMCSKTPRQKFLKYWWDWKSEIDPKSSSGNYYRVIRNASSQTETVETYDEDGNLLGKVKFFWRGIKLVRTESYDAKGCMQYFQIYIYHCFGWPKRVEVYSSDGILLKVASEDI